MKRFTDSTRIIRAIAVLVVALSATAFAAAAPMGESTFGPGYGGMMGGGMMSGGHGYYGFPQGDRIGMEEVTEALEDFIRYNRLTDIEVGEVMEFEQNYYAQLRETDSGLGALEVLIDPYSGYVSAEPGPNMMWNTKYSHMRGWGRGFTQSMKIDEEEAVRFAQDYLDSHNTGLTADAHADEFYGYYTLHVSDKDGIVGMLSINGFDGSVWDHNWHGDYIAMNDSDRD